MGYRFVLRILEYPLTVSQQGQFDFKSWWENVGVALIYKDYKLAFRLINFEKTLVLTSEVDIRNWLPGDIVCDEKLYIPYDMPTGTYNI